MLNKIKQTLPTSRKKRLILLAALVAGLFLIGAVGAWFYNNQLSDTDVVTVDGEVSMVQESLEENDKSKALEHARRALARDPNNIDNILMVANLAKEDNPDESKQLFARALDAYKKQNKPDENGKTAITYWAAAGLAENAGQIDQARHYYQKVVDVADPSDSYHQSIAKQSREALERLR